MRRQESESLMSLEIQISMEQPPKCVSAVFIGRFDRRRFDGISLLNRLHESHAILLFQARGAEVRQDCRGWPGGGVCE